MRRYTEKTVHIKSVEAIQCDQCGKDCEGAEDMFGINHATLDAAWGYGSKSDGSKFEVHLCESCFYSVLDFIRGERRKTLGCFDYAHDYDPLYGENEDNETV
jgi:hypothetical protein